MPNELCQEVEDIVKEEAKNNIPKSRRKKAKCLLEDAIDIADRRREMKTKGASREDIKQLNANVQQARKKRGISKRHAKK